MKKDDHLYAVNAAMHKEKKAKQKKRAKQRARRYSPFQDSIKYHESFA